MGKSRSQFIKGGALALLLALFTTTFPQSAQAGSRNGMLGLTAAFDYANESMGDLNDLLSASNLSAMHQAIGGGGSIAYGFNDNVMVGINVDYLYASSDTANTGGGNDFHLRFPLLETALTASYVWWDAMPSIDTKATLGLAYENLNGSDASNAPGFTSANYTASGLGIFGTVGAEWFLKPQLSLGLDVGYRYVRLSPIAVSTGGNVLTAGGSNAVADFSGLMARVGLSWYIDLASRIIESR